MNGFVEEVGLKSFRHLASLVLGSWIALIVAAPVSAAPEIHRLSLVLSANPTQIVGGDLNHFIDNYNHTVLAPKDLEPLGDISFAWYNQAELRYFVRQNWAVSGGFGQIRQETRKEYLPRIAQIITLRSAIVSVPVHVGVTYYLAPYTQGDFQARAYVGGGFMSLTNNKIVLEQLEFHTDSATTLGGSRRSKLRRDAPGYFLEFGGHMFFASRYSVMIGAIYRSAVIRGMHETREVVVPNGSETVTQIEVDPPSLTLDTSGLGLRMGVGIGF